MFPNRSILNLVHLVELFLEHNEVFSLWRLFVEHAILELFESVHNLQEVSLTQEELEIFLTCLIQDSVHWEQKCSLFEVLPQGVLLVLLDFVEVSACRSHLSEVCRHVCLD